MVRQCVSARIADKSMKRILPVIVTAQLFCTSLWFAGNAVLNDLAGGIQTGASFLAWLTNAVQLGFIAGTLLFALLSVADRFPPSLVFFVCSIAAALANLGMVIGGVSAELILFFRFLTGFFLAGIYPVGMKIASDYYQKGLGQSLGFLVGALVLGTALPHLLRSLTTALPWQVVIVVTSVSSILGGFLLWRLVPDGPFRKPGAGVSVAAFGGAFKNSRFRAAAWGYFGHMWELYTFWAFVPVMLATYNAQHTRADLPVSGLTFLIIASGGLSCVVGGWLASRFGTRTVALTALGLSGSCCLLSPLFLLNASVPILLAFLFFWGMVVVADSPLFSTLVAQNAPETGRGSALALVTCIGFSVTIISIQLLQGLVERLNPAYIYTLLAIGPLAGLLATFTNQRTNPVSNQINQTTTPPERL